MDLKSNFKVENIPISESHFSLSLKSVLPLEIIYCFTTRQFLELIFQLKELAIKWIFLSNSGKVLK